MRYDCKPPPNKSNSLYVDLKKSTVNSEEQALIPLHIGVLDPSTKKVVLNSYDHGWQEKMDYVSDLCKVESFHIVIKVSSSGYEVTINDNTYPEFKHRHDLQNICAIEVGGVINLKYISIENLRDDFSEECQLHCEGLMNQEEFSHINAPVLLALNSFVPEPALHSTITGGMTGRKIFVKGMPLEGHPRFFVAFKEADGDDILFQFNVDFDEQQCNINSYESGSWKERMEIKDQPFEYDKQFMMTLVCDNVEMVVFLEDIVLTRFCHRHLPYKMNLLKIEGVKILAVALLPGYQPV
uniref:Galectin n=1 Tax=Eptatretus burgeri TaxID=7764 RepID=A0A8C4WT01_EPTBU